MAHTIPRDIITAAKAGMSKYKVPAAITIAQWALESHYGDSMPPESNNPFGIKAQGSQPYVTAWTWEEYGGRKIRVQQRFRKFASLTDAFEAHARLLATSRLYKAAMKHVDDPDLFAKALLHIYATDSDYDKKLISIMKKYNLYQYDNV